MKLEDRPPYSHAWAALLLRLLVGWIFLTEYELLSRIAFRLEYHRRAKIAPSKSLPNVVS